MSKPTHYVSIGLGEYQKLVGPVSESAAEKIRQEATWAAEGDAVLDIQCRILNVADAIKWSDDEYHEIQTAAVKVSERRRAREIARGEYP